MAENWLLPAPVEVPAALREAVGGHPLVARLLAQRGLTDPARARAFLDPRHYTPASPLALPGMAACVALLRSQIVAGGRVRIWGDLDADGHTSTTVLYEALRQAGANVDYQLPRPDEGHGLHPRVIGEAARDGIALLITCDNGIGEAEMVTRGVQAGLQVIITDHHDLPAQLPPAQAVVNPKMLPAGHPLAALSGVGVAYMVAQALLDDPTHADALEQMLDVVALGLVADVATLVDDARALVQRGLVVLRATRRPGLRAMMELAEIEIAHANELDIAFQLGPRLNAAGRLADSERAVRLLTTRDAAEGQALAGELEALHRDRQARTEAAQAEAEALLQRSPMWRQEPALLLESDRWEVGVLGTVAGTLARRYNRPAILVAHQAGAPSAASARSVEGVDIHAAIAAQREHLLREGGHPMAAGFSILPEQLPAFRRGLMAWLRRTTPSPPAIAALPVDAELPWAEISLDLARDLARLGPFGAGNRRPLLLTTSGTLVRVEDVSRTHATAHRHLYLDDDEARPLRFTRADDATRLVRFTWFNAQELPSVGERLDLAFHLGVNAWHGQERAELELVEWRPSAAARQALAALVAGREVVDWRAAPDAADKLTALRAALGERLLLWAEGTTAPPPAGALTRRDLAARRAPALALLTSPPGPEALEWLLEQVQPQVVYLLPPLAVAEGSATELVTQVAGMVRVARRDHGGKLDTLRMAARIGASQAAIVAALRGLEAAGVIALQREPEGLVVRDAPAQAAVDAGALAQAQQSLGYLWREMRAYRAAYPTQPLAALFHKDRD